MVSATLVIPAGLLPQRQGLEQGRTGMALIPATGLLVIANVIIATGASVSPSDRSARLKATNRLGPRLPGGSLPARLAHLTNARSQGGLGDFLGWQGGQGGIGVKDVDLEQGSGIPGALALALPI